MDVYKMLKLADAKRKLKVAVLDDEQDAVDHLVEFIKLTDGFELALSGNNPMDLLKRLKLEAVDVLFLDVEMPGMDGMKLIPQLNFIKTMNPLIAHLEVVICSAHEHFARKSFDYKVADYLTKPIYFDRYMEAVYEVKKRLLPVGLNDLDGKNDCLLLFSQRGLEIARVNYDQIIYVEAKDDKTWLWVNATDYFETYEKMGSVLLRLPRSNFVQVHRSYAISLDHFRRIVGESGKKDKVIILEGVDVGIPIGGKARYPLFDRWLTENAVRGRRCTSTDRTGTR